MSLIIRRNNCTVINIIPPINLFLSNFMRYWHFIGHILTLYKIKRLITLLISAKYVLIQKRIKSFPSLQWSSPQTFFYCPHHARAREDAAYEQRCKILQTSALNSWQWQKSGFTSRCSQYSCLDAHTTNFYKASSRYLSILHTYTQTRIIHAFMHTHTHTHTHIYI
jgi:hypothetical protein